MTVDLKRTVYLKLELDGTGDSRIFEGDLRSCTMQALKFLMSPEARWTKRNGDPRMVWTWAQTPFKATAKGEESLITKSNEILQGLDLSGIEILDDEEIEAQRKAWMGDPRILRLIQVNTFAGEAEKCLPSERTELLNYARTTWPEFYDSFELKHLA